MDLNSLKTYKKDILLFINSAKELVSKFECIQELFTDEKSINKRNNEFSIHSLDNEVSISDCANDYELNYNSINYSYLHQFSKYSQKALNLNYSYINYTEIKYDQKISQKEVGSKINSEDYSFIVEEYNNTNPDVEESNILKCNPIGQIDFSNFRPNNNEIIEKNELNPNDTDSNVQNPVSKLQFIKNLNLNIDNTKNFIIGKLSKKLKEKEKLKNFFKNVINNSHNDSKKNDSKNSFNESRNHDSEKKQSSSLLNQLSGIIMNNSSKFNPIKSNISNHQQDDNNNNENISMPQNNSLNNPDSHPISNRNLTVKATDRKLSSEFDRDLHKISHLLFELKNYPKSLVVIDQNMKIIYQNDDFCRNLFWDKSELHSKDFSQILQGTETLNQDECIAEVFSQIDNQDEEMKDIEWLFFDKELNKVNFNCRFKISKIVDDGQEISNLVIFMDSFCSRDDNPYIIDPKGPFYLSFSLVIAIALLFLVLQVPYDISFGSEQSASFNFNSDMVITGIFSVDIFLNFFVAYEDNVKKGFEQNNQKVAQNQLTGSFVMDLLATIPFDRLFTSIAFNTSIIKSIRIFKVFKLVKILRISKYVNFVGNKSFFEDNEFTNDLIVELKRNSGQFELMLQNSQILIGAHFYTIFFKFVKDVFIESGNKDWIQTQQPLDGLSQFNMYLFLLSENVKTALGLGVLSPQNPQEILLNLSWMFVGLSLFGQGIGNISSQLNNIQQDELEQYNACQFFQEMCDSNEIDPRIHQLVLSDLDEQQANAKERRFYKQGKMLSNQVLMQLETSLYKEFVESYPLFGKLSMQTIRIFKNSAKKGRGRLKIINGGVINDLIFIIKGKLTIQDEAMQFINEYTADELYGMQYLKSYFNLKQKIDINQVYEQTKEGKSLQEKTKDMEKQQEKLSDIKHFIHDKINQKLSITNNPQSRLPNSDNTFLPRFVEEDSIKLVVSQHLVASDDMEYITLPFKVLEEIFLNDMENFIIIYKYNLQFLELLKENDQAQSRERLSVFNSNSLPGLMLTKDSEIQEINKSLQNQSEEFDFSHYKGRPLNELICDENMINSIGKEKKDKKVKKISWWVDEPKEFSILIEGNEIHASMQNSYQTKIVRNESNDIVAEADDDINQYQLRKSILEVRVIHFEIKEVV